MAEMLQDLLQSIYQRIAQLGQAIQALKTSLDELNQNIETKISNLNQRISDFSNEINVTQTVHIDAIKEIGEGVTNELEKVKKGLALDSFESILKNLQNFEKLAQEVLNQDTVNLLLSEAIDSVKQMKESLSQVNTEEEEEEVSS
jgi:sugar-specific transcriptional regulator TrmB